MAEAAAAAGVVATTVKNLPVVFPDIKLDGRRTDSFCTVTNEGRSLNNQSHPEAPSQTGTFKFFGTCGTEALPGQTCYWQVRVEALLDPSIVHKEALCEAGVGFMTPLGNGGVYVRLVLEDKVKAVACQETLSKSEVELTSFNEKDPVRRTLGLLLNVQKKSLTFLDVTRKLVIGEQEVDMSQPLWPCVGVVRPASLAEAKVTLHVESGEALTLTPEIIALITSQLEINDD